MPNRSSHIDTPVFWGFIEKIFEMSYIKSIMALVGIVMAFVFDGNEEILITIYSLIAIDTFLGTWIAAKKCELSSRGFYRVSVKCLIYFLMIVTGRLVDKHVPIQMAAPIMDSFLVGTEAFSILENVSKLGFPVPNKLVKMLKIYYDKK